MKIIISSFGYKFGTPEDADLLLDARKLRNPFKNKKLREKTGLADDVWKFVTADPRWLQWKAKAEWEATKIVEQAELQGQAQVMIGIGCTGGRHRSVVATLELARFFHWDGELSFLFPKKSGTHEVMVGHRDMNKEGEVMGKLRNIKDILGTISIMPIPAMSKKKAPWD